MFKHKIIKYFLIFLLTISFLIFIALLRISYKPIDITYLNKYLPKINKYIEDLNAKQITFDLNLFNNEATINLKDTKF